MSDTSGWISLKHLVQEILLETGREEGFRKKCTHFVINGIRDLNTYHIDNIKTTKVTCNDIGIIDMPTDYVSFRGLSMTDGGLTWTLTRRDDLIRTTTELDGEETLDSDIGEGVSIDTGTDYGYATVGGKNDYYFTIDERNTRFIVRPLPSTTRTFFLQYTSSGLDLNEGNAITVPVKVKDALKCYVLYKEALYNDKGNKSFAGLYKSEYREEISKLRFLDLPTADELRDMIYENYENIRR